MARVKRAVASKKHRKTTLERAKGYYGNKSRSYRAANEQVMHSLQYAYRDRRARKGDFRQLWIQRINAACRLNGTTYAEVHRRPEGQRCRGRSQGPRRPRGHRPGGVHRPGRGGQRRVDQRLNLAAPTTLVGVEPAPLSANNPRLITLRRLSGRRRARLDAGAFVIEGPVPVAEALAAGAAIDEVYVDGEAWASAEPGSALRDAVEAAAATGCPVWSLGPGALAKAADTVTPQGLLAVAPRRPVELADLVADTSPHRPDPRAGRRRRPRQRRHPGARRRGRRCRGRGVRRHQHRPLRPQGRAGGSRFGAAPAGGRGRRHRRGPRRCFAAAVVAWWPPSPRGEWPRRPSTSSAPWRCSSARGPRPRRPCRRRQRRAPHHPARPPGSSPSTPPWPVPWCCSRRPASAAAPARQSIGRPTARPTGSTTDDRRHHPHRGRGPGPHRGGRHPRRAARRRGRAARQEGSSSRR